MNEKKSKAIRREVNAEMAGDKHAPPRELIKMKTGSVVNIPLSVRSMYRRVKREWLRLDMAKGASLVAPSIVRNRRAKVRTSRPQLDDRIAIVERPLGLIREHCKPTLKANVLGDFEAVDHPVYADAKLAAKYGRGDIVKRIARQFV
jgi:hypothetical protein